MRIIFDNNIWISFLIGKRLAALRTVFQRQNVEVFFCDELEHEFLDVAHRPKIQKYVDAHQLKRVYHLMIEFCHRAMITTKKKAPVRDPKDVYLLTLADTVKADYLVSGDYDLTDIKQYNQTKIVDFSTFITLLQTTEQDESL